MDSEMTHIKDRLDQHDFRLRAVESNLAVLPQINTKLDRLIDAEHGTTLAVQETRLASLETDVAAMKSEVGFVRDRIKSWKTPVGILIMIVTAASVAAMVGVDISSPF